MCSTFVVLQPIYDHIEASKSKALHVKMTARLPLKAALGQKR